ncbi:hypothetical protein F5B19DRAFT_445382 [Rostrohypoxylon terebratum]|nr:hypothetical protein F5B19DRAFT_445382 [Rostrohypoxylon terebratum]
MSLCLVTYFLSSFPCPCCSFQRIYGKGCDGVEMAKGKIPSRGLSYIDFHMLFYVQIALSPPRPGFSSLEPSLNVWRGLKIYDGQLVLFWGEIWATDCGLGTMVLGMGQKLSGQGPHGLPDMI